MQSETQDLPANMDFDGHRIYNADDFESSSPFYDYKSSTETTDEAPCNLQTTVMFDRSFLPAFYSIVFLLGMLGNVLVLVVLLQNRWRLQSTDIFLLHLALADILLVITLPFWATQAVSGWIFGNVLCKMVASIFKINFYACTFLLVCISCDRYLSIVYAVQLYKKHRTHLVHWSCLLVWCLCIGLSIPDMVYYRVTYEPRANVTDCQPDFGHLDSKTWKISLTFLYHIVGFLIPLCFMVYCYTHIIHSLCQTHGFKKQKALRVVIAVVVIFFLCWTPYNIVALLDTMNILNVLPDNCTTDSNIDIALSVTSGLCYFHSCLNPLLYAFVGAKFKMKLVELLSKLSCICPQIVKKYIKYNPPAKPSTWSESGDTTVSAM
uniref:C-X-C chemokine receptor type 3 n=1 Tax=Xenopus laevis TaxID=8355 RepID=K7ZRA2_XENLA|nr:C-X-C chemokine receptor type 3 [Xenopus laevis]